MRQIVLDTETTGLEPARGHRIIEIGCVELLHRRASGRTFHRYLNPDREVDQGALAVHGLSRERLQHEPRFADVAAALLEFITGAELIIHNAPFDVAFLELELSLLAARGTGSEPVRIASLCRVLDTLALARTLHPGQRNSLDALCRRYRVDNTHRELHGALLDARLLADVYLAMTGGQNALELEQAVHPGENSHGVPGGAAAGAGADRPTGPLRVVRATAAELEAHASLLTLIERASGGRCGWRELEGSEGPGESTAAPQPAEPAELIGSSGSS